jgi:hypothetical protein
VNSPVSLASRLKCKQTNPRFFTNVIILKDIKCFQIWVYFEGIGINFNFENFQNKIFPLFILRTIQSMHARYHRTLQHLWKIEGWFVSSLHLNFSNDFAILTCTIRMRELTGCANTGTKTVHGRIIYIIETVSQTRCFVMWYINVIFIEFIKFTTYETVLI